ncbi:hypothetical protein [Winogradskyella sp. UBA3174]|uniref:hypothetical protein n=1 Tax=Winogradskyella sp. UBA3174 TaxID=1947785 RepID=UPI0025F388D2|nr:hypothetical protein [Winogradskyella sp. UBA3174]|tara:strand:- start:12035 stop:12667 length:633 start_codon:yes stop_codon:yes gene_type:complete
MKRILYVCFFAVLLLSCTTSDNDQDPESNFYALTEGNEWIYKHYKYNSYTETYDDTGVLDAVSIVGTEIIDNNTYFKFRRFTTGNEEGITFCNPNGEHFELLRDSVGYLVRNDGSIKYTNNDFVTRVINQQSWGTIYEQLIATDHEITVEAGTFESTYTQRFAITANGEQAEGLDHHYYTDGVGLIYDTTSFVTQNIPTIVRRLDSYDVE